MSSTAQGVVPADLGLSHGALQIGTYVSTTLFGVMSMQTYYFYVNYPNERKLLKGLVAWIWLFEFLHAVFITCSIVTESVGNSGFVPFAIAAIWSATVTCSIQAYFAYRIHILSQCWEITLICWALSTMQYLISLVASVKELKVKNVIELDHKWKWIITVEFAVTVANDIIIAASLSYYLYRSRNGLPPTDRLIHRLIKFTIQTGLLTSAFTIIMLILFLVMSDNYTWLCIFGFLAELYSISLLATLNSRSRLTSKYIGNGPMSEIVFPNVSSSAAYRSLERPHSVKGTRDWDVESDGDNRGGIP